MTAPLSPDAGSVIADIAVRHGLSREAVLAMLHALQVGGGTMAQFDIPELGGSGQWMRGGMTMVGNMFDNALKARVDALCAELSQLLASSDVLPARDRSAAGGWWPSDLGVPSATGGQNDARYAVFPAIRRLAIQNNGGTQVFDTGDHRIGGVQQQQGGRAGVVTFTSQLGTFDVSSLTELGAGQVPEASAPAAPTQPPAPAGGDAAAIIAAIEALAGLHERGILSDDEFSAKKTELLGRL
ncbi:MAG: SHOCT domain-containing protein [Mycobacterium sp.]